MNTRFLLRLPALFLSLVILSAVSVFAQDDFQLDPNCNGKDAVFAPFADHVTVYCDETFMYVESDGLGDHEMMVGITAWNQQVPLPHPYEENNAWQVPLNPVLADEITPSNPMGFTGVFINGVGFFDPNALPFGEYQPEFDTVLRGELDVCSGHAGQADDYHYHAAPYCILEDVEPGSIVGFALDGFPIYGFTNADGSEPELDKCNGQTDETGYHYHITPEYPYILGCFSGVVDFDWQPRSHPIRHPGAPIEVEITSFVEDENGAVTLEYTYEGAVYSVRYQLDDDACYVFEYISAETTRTEQYCGNADDVRAGAGEMNYVTGETVERPPNNGNGDNPPPPNNGDAPPPPPGNGN